MADLGKNEPTTTNKSGLSPDPDEFKEQSTKTESKTPVKSKEVKPPEDKKDCKGCRIKRFFKSFLTFFKEHECHETVPGDSYRFFWQDDLEIHLSYLIYRLLISMGHSFLLTVSMFTLFVNCTPVGEDKCITHHAQLHISWPFYLTSVGIAMNFCQSTLGLLLTGFAYLEQRKCKKQNKVPEFYLNKKEYTFLSLTGTFWGLTTLCTVLAITIDTVYWIMIYEYDKPLTPQIINNTSEHLFNLVLLTIDNFFVAFPTQYRHCIHLFILGVWYPLWNLSYFAAGGLDFRHQHDYLYAFLNWHYPIRAVVVCAMISCFTIGMVVPLTISSYYYKCVLRAKCSRIHSAYQTMIQNNPPGNNV